MYDLSNMAIVVYLDVKFQAGKFLKKYQVRTTFSIPAVKQTKTFGNNQIKMSWATKKKYFPLYWLVNRDPCNGLL